jgi:hypothetical protein
MSGAAKHVPKWVGRNEGAPREGKVMGPDEGLYSPAVARVAQAAADVRAKKQEGFSARMKKLLAAMTPAERERLEKQMQKSDEEAARVQKKENELDKRDRVAAASSAISALRNPPKQTTPKKK